MKVLMVCHGNICRSPLAEGILQHKADEMGLAWQVDSAGTSGYHVGEPPHPLSQKVALMNGIDISGQRARQFKKTDFLEFDMIYVMDSGNYGDVKRIGREFWNEGKVRLIMNEVYARQDREVPDPWAGPESGYHEVFAMLDVACDKIIEKYATQKHHQQH